MIYLCLDRPVDAIISQAGGFPCSDRVIVEAREVEGEGEESVVLIG